MDFPSWRRALAVLGAIATVATVSLAEPLPANALTQELRSFGTMGTVLHVGAHPDDENTQLITYLSLGRGYRVGYLSLTRGDGGQNELGRDFDEKLGVARTQELLAARRLDHGRQFFTRAIDFGFSKSPEETLRFWDRDQVLSDVVRVIRQFRPDVIVTRFPIPPGSGGHGHHTASAILAVEAFKLAGDPTAYPEQLAQSLTVWQPKRVVWNSFGGSSAGGLTGPTVQMDIAGTDPVSGETFGTIANRSRGMHKTQGLGGFSGRTATGPNMQDFMLLAGLPGGPAWTNTGLAAASNGASDLMDGIDLTWNRVPGGAEIGQLAEAALAQFKADDPAASVPALLAIRTKLAAVPTDPLVADKRAQLDRILQACLGLQVEATIEQAEVVPGEKIAIKTAGAVLPHSSSVPRYYVNGRRVAAVGDADKRIITIPTDTPLTQPYWLREEGAASIARVSDPSLIGLPENPPSVRVEVEYAIGAQTLILGTEPVFVSGGTRRRLDIIPPVSLALNSEIFLLAPGTTKAVTVEVTAARTVNAGVLRLEAPAGWSVAPAQQNFRLPNVGDKARVIFNVTAPVQPDSGRLTATAEIDGHKYSNQRYEIRYDHIPVQLLQPPARARVASFALVTRGLNVGYLPGAGDSVAECLEQMGYVVRPLTGADLTPEKLAGLDAVVIGVRAFNERTDLKDNLPGLFAWVEAGGTVIAQYNRPNGLKAPQLGPYPLSIEGPAPALRVTDETAPVTFVATDHAALNGPNRIGPADFTGWVQERGAYFPSSWDRDHYTALLAMSDPGEAQPNSSILVARHGKGYYVYTGLAFFRQLPAGVPGAYRLFANLVSLGK